MQNDAIFSSCIVLSLCLISVMRLLSQVSYSLILLPDDVSTMTKCFTIKTMSPKSIFKSQMTFCLVWVCVCTPKYIHRRFFIAWCLSLKSHRLCMQMCLFHSPPPMTTTCNWSDICISFAWVSVLDDMGWRGRHWLASLYTKSEWPCGNLAGWVRLDKR